MSTDGEAPRPAATADARVRSRPGPPPEVEALAAARAEARVRRDWPRADALKSEIEAAGWKVEDAGRAWSLFPAVPADVVVDGMTRHGSAASVPSVLADPPTAVATVAVVASGDPTAVQRLIRSLRAHAPAGTHVVVVGNDPHPAWDLTLSAIAGSLAAAEAAGGAARDASDVEVIRTSRPLGAAAALNVAMRRARGAIVVLAAPEMELTGDAITPVVEELGDAATAVAGAIGLVAAALPHVAESAASDPDAIGGAWLAFRRADHVLLGPFDERFVDPAFLDTWWSLTLRAGGAPDAVPRRAVRLDLPLVRHATASVAEPDPRRDRLARRNGYRLLDGFRERTDLLADRTLTASGPVNRSLRSDRSGPGPR